MLFSVNPKTEIIKFSEKQEVKLSCRNKAIEIFLSMEKANTINIPG